MDNSNYILEPAIADMLKVIEPVFRESGVDYFLIGALARDIQLSARPGIHSKRKTRDVDIAVLLADEGQFLRIKAALIATGEFEETTHNAIKLIYRKSIEVDLLPFGGIEDEGRQLTLKTGVMLTMDMSGFSEVYPFVEYHEVADGLSLKVCTLEGLILLKLIANDDNSSRTKDITDIEHLIHVYFDLNGNEIYEGHMDIMDKYDTTLPTFLTLVSARTIGRKIKVLIRDSPGGIENLSRILSRRPTEAWQAMLAGLGDLP